MNDPIEMAKEAIPALERVLVIAKACAGDDKPVHVEPSDGVALLGAHLFVETLIAGLLVRVREDGAEASRNN